MRKSGLVAFCLSMVFPGAGHIYTLGLGQGVSRAMWFWLGLIASALFISIVIGIFLFPAVWIWCAFDAWGQANVMNRETKTFRALRLRQ